MSEFSRTFASLPDLGVGLGLRRELHDETLKATSTIKWLEFTPEEFMGSNGKSRQRLEEAASIFPLISHGINLSLGSTDELNAGYLAELKRLLDLYNVAWFSDHVSFASSDGVYVNNLLPLPRNKDTVEHIARHILQAQDYMQRPILVENISFYMPNPPGSYMSEAEFITAILDKADCGMLLDLNNIFVNSVNHSFDPFEFLQLLPLERVVQVHLAGHNYHEDMIIDTHSEAVCDPVYRLLEQLLLQCSPKGIMIERDGNFPEFAEIEKELIQVQSIVNKCNQAKQPRIENAIAIATTDSGLAAKEQEKKNRPGGKAKKTMSVNTKSTKTKSEKVVLSEVERVFSRVVVDKFAKRKVLSCINKACGKQCKGKCRGGFGKDHADTLDLYARITEAGALSSMSLMFPITERLLSESWNEVIDRYFHQYPPTGYVLAFIGDRFPEFLDSISDEFDLPFISEMADLEWNRIYASEAGSFQKRTLLEPDFSKQANPASRKPVLNPTLILRKYRFGITTIHSELYEPDCKQVDFGVAESVVFFRSSDDNTVSFHRIDDCLASVLEELPMSASYADLFQKLLKRHGMSDPVKQIIEYADNLTKLHKWQLILGDEELCASSSGSLEPGSGASSKDAQFSK